jgi:hypothetical protein
MYSLVIPVIQGEAHKHHPTFSIEVHCPPISSLVVPDQTKLNIAIRVHAIIDQRIPIMNVHELN